MHYVAKRHKTKGNSRLQRYSKGAEPKTQPKEKNKKQNKTKKKRTNTKKKDKIKKIIMKIIEKKNAKNALEKCIFSGGSFFDRPFFVLFENTPRSLLH